MWDRKRKSSVQVTEMLLGSPDYDIPEGIFPMIKTGPPRKLTLEQEILMVMMRLRLGVLIEDLAFCFNVASSTASSIVITWIVLLEKELGCVIKWPLGVLLEQHCHHALKECTQKLEQ